VRWLRQCESTKQISGGRDQDDPEWRFQGLSALWNRVRENHGSGEAARSGTRPEDSGAALGANRSVPRTCTYGDWQRTVAAGPSGFKQASPDAPDCEWESRKTMRDACPPYWRETTANQEKKFSLAKCPVLMDCSL